MNARASTSNPPPKFTKSSVPPSASSRSQSFASSPIRTFRDGVPPVKRRRLASTPTSSSLSLSTPRSSSSRPEQPAPADLHDARAASSMRVLDIWSALAERYNRRLDEDDVVDILTGKVIKDRGVLSEFPKPCNFGDLADKDDDPAINTDPGSEVADNLAEDEEDDDDEDGAEETDAFPSSDGLAAPQITRLAPLRPATSSSDAEDLREFLKVEAIRRELDGGDDSSEDEINILPPRPTPAKRVVTPARKASFTTRVKPRPLKTPAPLTESEEDFAVREFDGNDVHRGYRARRTPSPEALPSVHSPPPPSSSPGPYSSVSLPSSPLTSHTPLNPYRAYRGPHTKESFGSPTPKRQPLASTSRRTLEDSLHEIDLEFPPPQPRAPSIFGKRPSSAFIIDLSLSDDETQDERPRPQSKVTTNPKPLALEPRVAKKTGSAVTPKKLVPFVLIETKRPSLVTPAPTTVASELVSVPADPDSVTPLKKIASLKSRPGPQTQVTTPKPISRPKPSRKSTAKPKSTRSNRSTESGASTTTTRPRSKTPRKPPEVFVDTECDDRSSPPSPPSPSPVPPRSPRIRSALKRKRIISSESSSGGEQGSRTKADSGQRTPPPDSSRIQACTIMTPEVIVIDACDRSDGPEAGELKPRTRSQSRSKATKEVASTPAPASTTPAVTSFGDERREDDTPNRLDGSYTHFPSPPPLPVGFPDQTHQPFTPYSEHPPFRDHAISFSHVPYPNHDHTQYGHGQYPFFQDSNTQALLAQAVTQLAVLVNGGRPLPQMGHTGGMPGNMPSMNGIPGSPGWGMFPAWPPSTPTTFRYPYGHDHQQRPFQNQGPYVTGSGAGPSMPPPALPPSSSTFPSSLSLSESIPAVRETGVQERATSRTRSRSKSKRRVTFALDPSSGSGPTDGANDLAETSKRRTEGSPPMTRGRSQRKGVGNGTPGPQVNGKGGSKLDKAYQDSELDVGDPGSEGGVDRRLPPKSHNDVRGQKPGPGER